MKPKPPVSGQIVQSGNAAGGHIAGGDVTTVGEVHVHAPTPPKETALSRLYRRLKEEAAADEALTEYIEQLKIFTRVVENETVIGLDGKLGAAQRRDQIDMAMAMKEMVYSDLRQNLFSRTFQTIYATLMAKVHEEFQTWIRPAIAQGASRSDIDQLINEKIVKPISAELDDCSAFDGAAIPLVRGMLYFLTGNCHLVWH